MKKSENMTDPEPCRIKQEDAEEQKGWCIFFFLQQVYKTSSSPSDLWLLLEKIIKAVK